jgi:predicted ferric reductase
MRRALVGFLLGLGLLIVLDALGARLGLVPGIVPKLEGSAAWTTARAAGVTAFIALSLDVAFGLFLSTGAFDRVLSRARSVEIHRWLSSAALAMIGVHSLVLVFDRFVHFDVIDALVPFTSGYRPFAVGLGVLAAYGALVLQASFLLRRRIGARAWRKLHYLSFVVFPVALAHGLFAGSDAGAWPMRALYLGAGTLVAGLALYRAYSSMAPGSRSTS